MECLDIRDGFKKFHIYVESGAYEEVAVENFKTRSQPAIVQMKSLFEFGGIC